MVHCSPFLPPRQEDADIMFSLRFVVLPGSFSDFPANTKTRDLSLKNKSL